MREWERGLRSRRGLVRYREIRSRAHEWLRWYSIEGGRGGGGGGWNDDAVAASLLCVLYFETGGVTLFISSGSWLEYISPVHTLLFHNRNRERQREREKLYSSLMKPSRLFAARFLEEPESEGAKRKRKVGGFFYGKNGDEFPDSTWGCLWETLHFQRKQRGGDTHFNCFHYIFYSYLYLLNFFLNLIFIKIQLVWKLSKIFK